MSTGVNTASVVKDLPIGAVGALTIAGIRLSDIVLIVTLLYTFLRIAKLIYSWATEHKQKKKVKGGNNG